MTVMSGTSQSTTADLAPEDIEQLGYELDAIRQDVIDSRGARDAAYIRRTIKVQRSLELSSRVILLASRYRPAWILGTAALASAKIIDNLELGHNILHGQWDWMRDPKIHSTTWDWDLAATPGAWKRQHNEEHHKYTNIVGKDHDLGWSVMRMAEEEPWEPWMLIQWFGQAMAGIFFHHSIAAYDVDREFSAHLRSLDFDIELTPESRAELKKTLTKVGKLLLKDCVVFPLLSGRGFKATLTANITASFVRNVWTQSVIMCGHFPAGVQTFELAAVPENETRGEWYLRQMLGSADVSGPKLLHFMSGNLTQQIEHHIFPDLPSNRYTEIAPRVEALFEKYGLRYNSASLPRQFGSAWLKVFRLSFPNGWLEETNRHNLVPQFKKLRRMVKEHRAAAERSAPHSNTARDQAERGEPDAGVSRPDGCGEREGAVWGSVSPTLSPHPLRSSTAGVRRHSRGG